MPGLQMRRFNTKMTHAEFQVDRTSLDKRGGRGGGGGKKGFYPKLFLLHYEFTHYAFSLSLFMEICTCHARVRV